MNFKTQIILLFEYGQHGENLNSVRLQTVNQ
jgi:hypothetical protein